MQNTYLVHANTWEYMPIPTNTEYWGDETRMLRRGVIHVITYQTILNTYKYKQSICKHVPNPNRRNMRILSHLYSDFACICMYLVCIGLYTTNTIQTNTQWILTNGGIYVSQIMCDWICLYWYKCTCIVLYCFVLTCIGPYEMTWRTAALVAR